MVRAHESLAFFQERERREREKCTGHCTQFLAGETWIHLQITKQVTYFVNFLQFPVNNVGLVLFSSSGS